jgi:hypothetical protein
MVDGRTSPGRSLKKIHVGIRPKVLDATSVRALGLNLFSSLNAELPFLPESKANERGYVHHTRSIQKSLRRILPSSPSAIGRQYALANDAS